MKLTAELINGAPRYLNALREREIDLRGTGVIGRAWRCVTLTRVAMAQPTRSRLSRTLAPPRCATRPLTHIRDSLSLH